MPQTAHAISLRGKASRSGERSHVAEHVPHWKHFLRELPPCRLSNQMKSRSGFTRTGLPFTELAEATCGLSRRSVSRSPCALGVAVPTVRFPLATPARYIPLNGFMPYSSTTSMNLSNITGNRSYSAISN